jgi:hypothetical protein
MAGNAISTTKMRFGLAFWNSLSVRARLIPVFIAIKVVPVVLVLVLVWIAWNQTLETAGDLGVDVEEFVDAANPAVSDTAAARGPDVLYVASLPSIERRRLDAERSDREAGFRPSSPNNSSPMESTFPTSSAPAPVRGSLASSSSRRGPPGNAAFLSSRGNTLAPAEKARSANVSGHRAPGEAGNGKRRAAPLLA